MSLVVRVGGARASWWLETLRDLLPELAVRAWDDPGDRSQVEYAVVWQPPPGGLKTFPNLKAIVSMGAGVDHVLRDPELPRHLRRSDAHTSELHSLMRISYAVFC